ADLNITLDATIQGLNRAPVLLQVEDIPYHDIGPGDRGSAGARGLAQAVHKGNPHAVDHLVGYLHGNNLPTQAVPAQLIAILFDQPGREDRSQLAGHIVVIAQGAFDQFFLNASLNVGQQDSQLGPGQALVTGLALQDDVVLRNELQRPIESAGGFQVIDQAPVFLNAQGGLGFCNTQRLGLAVVVLQNQIRDLVRHVCQQLVTLLFRQAPFGHDLAEHDLDVHFMVGTIHATGIVDEVGVETAAIQGVFNPSTL